jgi:hypothetical protein
MAHFESRAQVCNRKRLARVNSPVRIERLDHRGAEWLGGKPLDG